MTTYPINHETVNGSIECERGQIGTTGKLTNTAATDKVALTLWTAFPQRPHKYITETNNTSSYNITIPSVGATNVNFAVPGWKCVFLHNDRGSYQTLFPTVNYGIYQTENITVMRTTNAVGSFSSVMLGSSIRTIKYLDAYTNSGVGTSVTPQILLNNDFGGLTFRNSIVTSFRHDVFRVDTTAFSGVELTQSNRTNGVYAYAGSFGALDAAAATGMAIGRYTAINSTGGIFIRSGARSQPVPFLFSAIKSIVISGDESEFEGCGFYQFAGGAVSSGTVTESGANWAQFLCKEGWRASSTAKRSCRYVVINSLNATIAIECFVHYYEFTGNAAVKKIYATVTTYMNAGVLTFQSPVITDSQTGTPSGVLIIATLETVNITPTRGYVGIALTPSVGNVADFMCITKVQVNSFTF